jgi:prophage maintenance system killer protein
MATREHHTAPGDHGTQLHYLTVQDMLWINLQITKQVNTFNFATLEEATYYQYAYGQSRDLPRQAGRLLKGFLKLKPFSEGNEATGFIGCVAFLLVNGMSLSLPDDQGAAWLARAQKGELDPEEALPKLVVADEAVHSALLQNVEQAVREAMQRFEQTLAPFVVANSSAE